MNPKAPPFAVTDLTSTIVPTQDVEYWEARALAAEAALAEALDEIDRLRRKYEPDESKMNAWLPFVTGKH